MIGIHRHPRIADRADHTPPVRIFAKERRLDEGAVRDTHTDRLCIGKRFCALHMNRDELGRPLTICRNLFRDALAECEQGLLERLVVRIFLRDLRISCSTVGEDDCHIVCTHITVDRDHIEAVLNDLRQRILQEHTVDIHIRCNKAEHRRHIGANHARALCDNTETNFLAANHNGGCSCLGIGIRRDDCIARIHTAIRRERLYSCMNPPLYLVHRQKLTDDARRTDNDIR